MGTIHVIATPIGNLEDITLRALRLLAEVDLLFAEDTRRTRILLDRHQIRARPVSLNAHNEKARIERALDVLGQGGDIALVSDAGTPLVSDPGERLVRAAIADGHRVEALPGPSAVLAALVVSGLPSCPFVFMGFLPRRASARRSLLESYRHRVETLVLFESPHRVAGTLRDLSAVLGSRRASVARELTKLHEEVVRGELAELAEHFASGARGEFSVVIEGCPASEIAQDAVMGSEELEAEILTQTRAGLRPREIAAQLAPRAKLSKREIYARAVAAREDT